MNAHDFGRRETTARYTHVAINMLRSITSPLDRIIPPGSPPEKPRPNTPPLHRLHRAGARPLALQDRRRQYRAHRGGTRLRQRQPAMHTAAFPGGRGHRPPRELPGRRLDPRRQASPAFWSASTWRSAPRSLLCSLRVRNASPRCAIDFLVERFQHQPWRLGRR